MTDEVVAEIGKALGHPARVRIIMMFRLGRCLTASSIAHQCELAQSTVSEHLRVLKKANLLFSRKDGTRVWYCLRRSVLREYSAVVGDLAGHHALEMV